jgi:hypothetical protein
MTNDTTFLERHRLEPHVGHSHHENLLRNIHDAIRRKEMITNLLWAELHNTPI